MRGVRNPDMAWALALAGVALGLRLARLGAEPMWVDEAYTWHVARLPLWGIVTQPEQTPPLYNFIMHLWVQLAGESLAALRFPGAVLGAAGVAALFLLARRFMTRPWAAAAAMMLCLDQLMLRYAQTARTYTLFVLAAIVSTHLLLGLARLDPSGTVARRRRVAYTAAATALLYSHVYGMFVLLAHALSVGMRSRSPRSTWAERWQDAWPTLRLQGFALLAFAPWAGMLVERTLAVARHFWIHAPTVGTVLNVASGAIGFGAPWRILVPILVAVAATAAYGGWWLLRRRDPDARADAWLLALWLALPVAVPLIISLRIPILTTSYTMGAWPALYVLVALGCSRFRPPTGAFLVSVLLATMLSAAASTYVTPQQQDWDSAVHLVDAQAGPGDVVLFSLGYCGNSTEALQCPFDYYSKRTDLRLEPFVDGYRSVDPSDVPRLRNLTAQEPSVWVMYSDGGDPDGLIAQTLAEHHVRVLDTEFFRVHVAHWQRQGPAS